MRIALVAVALTACSGSQSTPPAHVPVSPIAEMEVEPLSALRSDAHVVYEADVDLGGPALEHIRLHQDGLLVVGSVGALLGEALRPYFDESFFGVVAPGHVVIGIEQSRDEDPPKRWLVLKRAANTLTIVFDQVLPYQYADDLGIEIQDGELSVRESYGMTCERYWAPRDYMGDDTVPVPMDVERIVFRDNQEIRREPTGDEVDCGGGLTACPFVYLVDGSEERLMGEVLRSVRGEEAYTTQGLDISGDTQQEVTIVIREEKPEITYLDHVALVIVGEAVAPIQCAATPAPEFCEADHVPHRLAPGEELTLTFHAPAGARELVATGYYIPIPPR